MIMISKQLAEMLVKKVDDLTAGGGVTSPDDMVDLDDVINILRSHIPSDAKVEHHAEIVEELTKIYCRKNNDYGDSFGIGMKKYGIIMPIIRIEDKINRLTKLSMNGTKQMVANESLRDTLLDLANYAIMTVIELDKACAEQ